VWFTGDNIVSLLDILTVAFSVDNTVLSCGIAKESDIIASFMSAWTLGYGPFFLFLVSDSKSD
jgi:hypothetical protein